MGDIFVSPWCIPVVHKFTSWNAHELERAPYIMFVVTVTLIPQRLFRNFSESDSPFLYNDSAFDWSASDGVYTSYMILVLNLYILYINVIQLPPFSLKALASKRNYTRCAQETVY